MEEVSWRLVRLVGPTVVLGPPIAYYVFRDKQRRGESRALVSALGYGLLGLVGLFVYLYRHGKFAPTSDDGDEA